METNYTLKRLKLFGTVFAVMFTVLLFGSSAANAQITGATLAGDTEFCLDGDVTATYVASYVGTPQGTVTYSWGRTPEYGGSITADTQGSASLTWFKVTPTTTAAYIWVQITDTHAGGTDTFTATRYVSITSPIPDAAVAIPGGPFEICAGTATLMLTADDPNDTDDIYYAEGLWTVEGPSGHDANITSETYTIAQFNANSAVPGVYTLTWEVTNGLCDSKTATTTLTIHETPTAVTIAADPGLEVCDGAKIDFTATVDVGTATDFEYTWYLNSNVVGTDTNVYSLTPSVGTHTLTVFASSTVGCGTVSASIQTITVNPLPVVAGVEISPKIWDHVTTVSVTFADVVSPPFTITRKIEGENGYDFELQNISFSLPSPATAPFTFTVDAATLDIGLHTLTLEVTSGAGCIGIFTEPFTVTPPIHARFTPSYTTDDLGNNPDNVHTFGSTTKPFVNISVNAPSLGFAFYKGDVAYVPVTSQQNLLPSTDLGNFYRLRKWNTTDNAWENVSVSATRSGHIVNIIPGETLDVDAHYMLSFENIFRKTADSGGRISYVLAKSKELVGDDWAFDVTRTDAYESYSYGSLANYEYPHVIFKTSGLPIVSPLVDDFEPCLADNPLTVKFVNPVMYRTESEITDDPSHVFFLQELVFGGNASDDNDWVNIPFKAVPKDFVTVGNGAEHEGTGPTTIEIVPLDEDGEPLESLKLNHSYRVVMAEYSDGFGFIDMVLGDYVLNGTSDGSTEVKTSLDILIDFPRQEDGEGWFWSTTDEYLFHIAVNDVGVATTPFNHVMVYEAGSSIGTVTSTTTPYLYSATNSGTFTLTATATAGWNFAGWERNGEMLVDEDGDVIKDSPLTIHLHEEEANCATGIILYKAIFNANQYVFGTGFDPVQGKVTNTPTPDIGNATGTFDQGALLTLTATPEPGYRFVDWDFNSDLSGIETALTSAGLLTETYDNNQYVLREPAKLEVSFKGSDWDVEDTYIATATFVEFNPTIYAVAVASPTYDNPWAGVASITITTNFEIEASGQTTWSTDGFAYNWSRVKAGSDVKLVADNPPANPDNCEFQFAYWEEWKKVGETWVFDKIAGFDEELELEKVYNDRRYRAVYEPRIVNLVVDIPEDAAGNPLGTVVVEVNGEEFVNEDAPIIYGKTATITVYPVSDYQTYTWHDADGGIVTNVLFVERFADIQRRSVWNFTVDGCVDEIVLAPVIDKQRYMVEATIVDVTLGADNKQAFKGGEFDPTLTAFDVDTWYPEYVDGEPVFDGEFGVGFKYAGHTELFNDITAAGVYTDPYTFFPTGVSTLTYAKGWIAKGSTIELAATATPTYYEFVGWYLYDENYESEDTPDWRPLGKELKDRVINKGEQLEAWFKAIYPVANLHVSADPEVESGLFTASYSFPTGAGVVTPVAEIDEEVFINPAVGVTTATIYAEAEDGWVFDHKWTVDGEVVTTTAAVNYIAVGLEEYDEVEVVAHFVRDVYDISFASRGYRFKEAGSGDADEFETVTHGGTVTSSLPVGVTTATYGDKVTFSATQNAGWEFVNWMVGKVDGDNILKGYQIGDDKDELVYEIPALSYGSDIEIFAIYREVGTDVPGFPIYSLVTATDPVNFAATGHDGTYVHSVIVELFTEANENTLPGYEFSDRWEREDSEGNVVDLFVNEVQMLDEYVVTAIYEPINYTLYVSEYEDKGFGFIQIGTVTHTTMLSEPFTVASEPIWVKATPNVVEDGSVEYKFDKWTYEDGELVVDAAGQPAAAGFYFIPVVPEDDAILINIFAHFDVVTNTYTVTLANKIDGEHVADASVLTIDGEEVNSGVAEDGFLIDETVVISTDPAAGYKFLRWNDAEGNPYIAEKSFNHKIVGDVEFHAVYEKIPYTLTLIAGTEGGKVVMEEEEDTELTGTFYVGDLINVDAIADEGWKFVKWTETTAEGDLVYENAANEIPMPAEDYTLVAHFTQELHDVTFVVTGPEGDVEDAVITFASDNTNDAGDYVFEGFANGTYAFTVVLDGFNDYVGAVVIAGADKVVEVEFIACEVPVVELSVTAKTVTVDVDVDVFRVYLDGEFEGNEATIKGLEPGKDYVIGVRAICDAAGVAEYSAPVTMAFTTIQMGDVNGDGDVNGLDIRDMIAFMNGELTLDDIIFDAANIVDTDDVINVLDLVALVNILKGEATGTKAMVIDAADMYLSNEHIALSSAGNLAGIQFVLNGTDLRNVILEMIVPGFEVETWVADNQLHVLIYSMDNQIIPDGELIQISGATNLTWANAFGANQSAYQVDIRTQGTTDVPGLTADVTVNAFPNPSAGQFVTRIETPVSSNVDLRLYDLSGRVVAQENLLVNGYEEVPWNLDLRAGLYIMRMVATPEGQQGQSVSREVRILINK